MTSAPKRPRDTNRLGKLVVDIATGQAEDEDVTVNAAKRKAGQVGGSARATSLSSSRRTEIARAAASARWASNAAG